VVVDAGWRADTVLNGCAGDVERVVIVTTPGRSALSASYGLMKVVETRFPGTRFEVLVNQQHGENARHTFEYLHAAALTFLRRAIAMAGAVPDDACLRAGMRGGMTVEDAAAESDVAAAIGQMVVRFLAEMETPHVFPTQPRHLLGGA
jgi:MinD-like ATPase involved in chromosome partitioning or flagellar assembly